MSKYYLHYDPETGEVLSVSNENINDNAVEINVETAGEFMSGSKKFLHHYVDINDKTLNSTIKSENKSTSSLTLINNHSTGIEHLNVQWTQGVGWNFNLFYGTPADLVFYITLKNNLNYLIRTINISQNQISETIPFKYEIEKDINNITVLTKTVYPKYGLTIYDNN
jgi:hypothetical protein